MLKKVSTVLVLMSLFLRSYSQLPANTKVLTDMSQQLSSSYTTNYAKALALAKKQGWPIQRITKDGRIITLVGLDILGNPKFYETHNNTIAAATTRANQLWPGGSTGLNLSGSSDSVKSKLAVWDGGIALTSHVELTGRVMVKDGSTSVADHPTHTTGTMIATGINPIAKGMAYGAQNIQAYDYGNDAAEMSGAASKLLLSNHSYGQPAGWDYNGAAWAWYGDTTANAAQSYGFGYYDQSAQVYDSIAYNAPHYLICMSAGNSRGSDGPAVGSTYYYNGAYQTLRSVNIKGNGNYGTIAYTQNAKNILVVGAVNGIPLGYSSPSDVVMSDFSSWGPTDDGRIKPDIVADGVNVTSTISTSTTAYGSMSGTSMACPNATGSLYLVQEYYKRLHPAAFMRSATLKGLAIHTADEAGNAPGPDYAFGWGLLNVAKAAAVITSSYNHQTDTIVESTLNNGGTYTFTGTASGKGQLVATLTWTDPTIRAFTNKSQISDNTTPRLVDDLDMRITSGSQTFKPWILDPTVPSDAATRGDNVLDNVERINVDSLTPGQQYTITITHKGTLQRGTQDFSLIVSGIGGSAYCTSAPTSSAGTRIDSVSFGTIHNKNVPGCTTYSNFTTLSTGIQSRQTLPITVNVSSCDASTANKIVKVYIDYNSNGSFTDAGELVATSNVISGTGSFTTNIVTPAGLTIGNSSLMRIIAEETSNASDITPCGTYGKGETQDYSINIVAPSNADAALTSIINPNNASYFNPSQYLTISVKNNIATPISNVPVTATIKNGTTVVASYNVTLPITIAASSIASYTFQTPFNFDAGKTYTITASVNLANDQDNTNDTNTVTLSVPDRVVATGTAITCSNSTTIKVTNPSSANYFWFTAPTDNVPLLIGSTGTTTATPANNTFYFSSGIRTYVGPADRYVYGSGSYNSTSGYNIVTATLPVFLDNAKLFIGNAGRIKFVANPLAGAVSGNGQFSYYPTLGDSVTVNVYPTRPTAPVLGAQDNSTSDTGAVYYLGLHLDNSVYTSYLLTITCLDGASIFRNDAVSSNPYPVGLANVFTVTRNSIGNTTYSFFYNTQIYTEDAPSGKIPVVATAVAKPTITLSNDSLESSVGTYYQWYYNGTAINGAYSKNYKPVYSGSYYVVITNADGCASTSAPFSYVATAVTNVSADVIGLTASPNPNNGIFNVEFNVSTLSNVQIDLIDVSGKKVFSKAYGSYVGIFSNQLNAGNVATGVYILRVQLGNNVYHKTILVHK